VKVVTSVCEGILRLRASERVLPAVGYAGKAGYSGISRFAIHGHRKPYRMDPK
jgi:hypothetical protein